jgi:hypothetical protein
MKLLSFDSFINEQYEPILEGGAAGHMMHPFDDAGLTFDDFRKMIEAGLSGELNFEEDPTEKTDGQNIFATVKDGKAMFARNKGQLQNPIDLSGIEMMFADHPSEQVRATFTLAANDLAKALEALSKEDQEAYFDNGKNFMNMELIYSKNSNVINYDRDVIQFHGIKQTDGQGNITGEDSKPAKDLAKIIKDANNHIGQVFEIIPPQALKVAKDMDFDVNIDYFMNKVFKLQDEFNLQLNDPVSKYHEAWWRKEIDSNFPNLEQWVKDGLVQRWAYDDKKALDMRALAKMVDAKEVEKIKEYEKGDLKKKFKENIRPFEDLFLELGSVVLKNASNFLALSPDAEKRRLHDTIRKEAEAIKLNGDTKQIEKVEAELARLARIGGIESIIPTEGLVFKYKGNMYKLTGTFAAINQLMGIIKYGR